MAKTKQEQAYEAEMEKQKARAEKEARIISLTAALTSPTSEIGDYKAIKCLTAKALGENMPYDLAELEKKRQAARDEINAIQAELAKEG